MNFAQAAIALDGILTLLLEIRQRAEVRREGGRLQGTGE
ncbi:hypothetical protein L8106_17372 [Lyngbya sp. PCC 8106]|nr:hypothetical protein L8106_17372 [Lyngbya sp. PCC 8106]